MRARVVVAIVLCTVTPPPARSAHTRAHTRAHTKARTGTAPPRAAIVLDTTHPVTFDPVVALGSTIDGHVAGATARLFTRTNLAAMKSANFHPISYRLRTELGIEAWHWNPRGRWSDPVHARGYWTSDDVPRAPIRTSYGYRLPRRGSTMDQANEDGYSRIVDGDTATFWKSNPYLDRHFTGEPNARRPQWVLVDLEDARDVSAARIAWGLPFATRYDVQYWNGVPPRDPDDDNDGAWRTFAHGAISGASGGTVILHLADAPVQTQWLRVIMYESSHTAPRESRDVRDSLGYAIRELGAGTLGRDGVFHDVLQHGRSAARQTHVVASSTDPWHRAVDRDPGVEQPGIDLMFSSGITRGLPMLLPVGVLYDTPDNAAALLRYVRRRGYPVPRVELGEEPDGQYASPDDFASLYLRTADALRAVDRRVYLGGPSFQSNEIPGMMAWKQGAASRPWLTRFTDVLRARHRLGDLGFLSFEWYPFDTLCVPTEPQLAQTVPHLARALTRFRAEGLPAGVPILITEYGYSAFAGEPEVTRAGAILDAETAAAFLTLGGAQAFFYGTEPSSLDRNAECDSWGDNTTFITHDDRAAGAPTATYRAARMLTTEWADSSGGAHVLYRARAEAMEDARDSTPRIGAYPVRRPDGRLALLLVNRDSTHAWDVAPPMRGALDVWQLSAAEYQWHPHGANGFARPNRPPRHETIAGTQLVRLPPYSITVLRER